MTVTKPFDPDHIVERAQVPLLDERWKAALELAIPLERCYLLRLVQTDYASWLLTRVASLSEMYYNEDSLEE